jgi:hypothetical protein
MITPILSTHSSLWELCGCAYQVVRCIATARVVMPRSVVRLSAGRLNFSLADQVGGVPTACVHGPLSHGCVVSRSHEVAEDEA